MHILPSFFLIKIPFLLKSIKNNLLLEKVQQLGGYLFNYKGDDTQMSGVMAQEIKDVVQDSMDEIILPVTGNEVIVPYLIISEE